MGGLELASEDGFLDGLEEKVGDRGVDGQDHRGRVSGPEPCDPVLCVDLADDRPSRNLGRFSCRSWVSLLLLLQKILAHDLLPRRDNMNRRREKPRNNTRLSTKEQLLERRQLSRRPPMLLPLPQSHVDIKVDKVRGQGRDGVGSETRVEG